MTGYTRTVRPPVSYTDSLKRQQLQAPQYVDKNPKHYEEDHLIPLELAGDPRSHDNLWPEPWADADKKDQEENRLHKAVCSGQMSLATAQQEMREWTIRPAS
jgi:hypothetical protein